MIQPSMDSSARVPLNVAEFPQRRAESDQAEWRAFAQAATPETFCQAWLALQCSMIPDVARGVVVMRTAADERFVPVAAWPEGAFDPAGLAYALERALADGSGVVHRPDGGGCTIAFPVRLDEEVRGAVALLVEERADPLLQTALRQLQWGAGWLEVLLRRHAAPDEDSRRRLTLALHALATCLEAGDLASATTAVATELASRLDCERVYVGLLEDGAPRVVAVSHTAHFDKRATLIRTVEAALAEAIDQREVIAWPAVRSDAGARVPVVTRAHAELAAQTGAGAVVSLPLLAGGRPVGGIALERARGQTVDADFLEVSGSIARLLGPLVAVRIEAEMGAAGRLRRTAAASLEKLVGPGHPFVKLATAALVVLALGAALVTGTHRVTATTVVEGEVQRAVSAPFNGYLREVLVRPGDRVAKGAPLARIDDRDLKLEQTRVRGERAQLDRQQREAMAGSDRAALVVLAAQVEQAEAKLAMVDEQLARAELKAPFDGVVLTGDLTQTLGAPLERGQVLMELAPLDSYRLVLQVDERDVNRVQVGARGTLALAAMPGERLEFTVNRLTPVNVAREGRNYFRVEAALDRPHERLRPGMEGVGKIVAGERNLLWIWAHPLLDWARMGFWTWQP